MMDFIKGIVLQMEWQILNNEVQLKEIIEQIKALPQLIFKHSTRCSISAMAKARLDRQATTEKLTFYYLDLIVHRSLSNKIAELFNVPHESPQVLIIKNGECTYEESHNGIGFAEIMEQVK